MFEPKISAADATATPDWQRYLVAQDWHRFTPADHRTWDRLTERQVRLLEGRIVSPFLAGWKRLGLYEPGIPELERLSDRMEAATGWRCVSVAGIVPDAEFFAMLADKRFPVGNFIRDGRHLDYLEEPDCFHDIFGHAPLIAYQPMARLMEAMGNLGVAACAAGHGDIISRLYWYTVEFGLVREKGQTRILGAGLASSFGEARRSLEDDVPRPLFTIEEAAATPYENDHFQPMYFVSSALDDVAAELEALDPGALLGLAAYRPIRKPAAAAPSDSTSDSAT